MGIIDTNHEQASLVRPAMGNLVSVCDLTVEFRSDREREFAALKHVSFTIAQGEILGLLGESGCGKTTTALSLIQGLSDAARFTGGSITFNGDNLLSLSETRLREIRGSEISIVLQDSGVLNPVMRAGSQVSEVLRAHSSKKTTEMRKEICTLFSALGLSDCERIYGAFPHQLSGGERRRVAIAQALICKPRLLIADEPTTWLDGESTAEILSVFRHWRNMYGTAFLLISHDPDALMVADRLLVMYAGEIIESGPREEIFERPKHPYTKALLRCSTERSRARDLSSPPCNLPCIPGRAPDLSDTQPGCTFSARCDYRVSVCDLQHPELTAVSGNESVRCFQYPTNG